MEPSFDALLARLEQIAALAHENGNWVEGYEFASERGYLSDAEEVELARRQEQGKTHRAELESVLASLRADHAAAWQAHVARVVRVLDAVEARRASPAPGAIGTDLEFDAGVAGALRAEWQAHATGAPPARGLSWSLAVGAMLLARYGATVP